LKKSLFNLQDLTIITNSKWLFNEVDESFLSKHNRVLINSGIDVSAFSPQEITEFKRKHELKNQFIILGVAKMWTKRKGLNDFYEISKLLKKDEIILLDGGIADPSNRKTPDNIKLLKPAKNIEELSVLYSSADVFINPTYEDNFPTTNLESLACGTPVITYDTGGSPEAVDSNTGMVVQKGNIVGLYDAISAIRKNGKAFYTNSCRERAENNFNANIKYNEYFKLFNQ
jgi:glycosyltransferase involved in cell wall biosynthesis